MVVLYYRMMRDIVLERGVLGNQSSWYKYATAVVDAHENGEPPDRVSFDMSTYAIMNVSLLIARRLQVLVKALVPDGDKLWILLYDAVRIMLDSFLLQHLHILFCRHVTIVLLCGLYCTVCELVLLSSGF